MIDGKIKAKVLKTEDDRVLLGVYHQGFWHRIQARSQVPLQEGSWILGHLRVPLDGSLVLFQVLSDQPTPGIAHPDVDSEQKSIHGLDIEA